MKTALSILFCSLITSLCAQTPNSLQPLDSAKTQFKSSRNLNQEELDKFDYNQIVTLLENVIEADPNNTEARYFLGYTYSRMNAKDARGMIGMNLATLYKSSEQFEKIIQLSPHYTGEMIVLDPYSKLTAEWGSMAMSYWYHNKPDSAIWAFKEGKKRGGFGDFILELNKSVLNTCAQHSILISSGDNFSIPLWYLQIVDHYRPDVSVVDISLLNTYWYPTFLAKNKSVVFDLPEAVLDTLQYTEWNDSSITINNFTWTVKPTYYDQYLLRGDLVFLSLLRANKFQRELYFTIGFMEESRLSLGEYITPHVVADRLTVSNQEPPTYEEYKARITSALKLSAHLNLNSQDQVILFDNLRYNLFEQIHYYLTQDDKKKTKELLNLLDKYANEKKYPYHDESGKAYADYLRKRI